MEQEKWLNLTVEEIIDPDLPICDTHHHIRKFREPYLLPDFLRDISGGHNITSTILVQSHMNLKNERQDGMSAVEETEFIIASIAGLESGTDIAAGIVGYADLNQGDAIAPVLEAHVAAGKNRFRGIRFMPSGFPGDGTSAKSQNVFAEPAFRKGFANLRKYNLCYDIMLKRGEFRDFVDLAENFPDVPIIINHIGWFADQGQKGKDRDELFKEWQRELKLLAPCENVYIKLGGLGMKVFGMGWSLQAKPPDSKQLATEMAPYYLYCIEQFGVRRCMFESNFPVDKESYSYAVMWNAFKRLTKGFSAAERDALFQGAAIRAYRL
jgi:L-fuconolactonase